MQFINYNDLAFVRSMYTWVFLRCSHSIAYALCIYMQILESVCKLQKNFLYAQL